MVCSGAVRRLLLGGSMSLLLVVPGVAQAPGRVPGAAQAPGRAPGPRLEPIAETRLLMEGLAQSNFQGLERLLRDKPADVETWTFARGQALLIAETGNLLMLRPPRNTGQTAWLERANELRSAAARLARTLARRAIRSPCRPIAGRSCRRTSPPSSPEGGGDAG